MVQLEKARLLLTFRRAPFLQRITGFRGSPSHFLGVLFLLFASCLLMAFTEGPDFPSYVVWTRAAVAKDVFLIPSDTISPSGVPLWVWSPGVGLLLGLGGWFANPQVAVGDGLYPYIVATSWLYALLLWLCLGGLVLRLSRSLALTLFVLASGALATQLGFYSRAPASELLSCALIAALATAVLSEGQPSHALALVTGALAGLLVFVRTQLFIFAALGGLVFLYRIWEAGARGKRAVTLVATALVPMLASLIPTLIANRWMTGSYAESPYSMGDAEYSTFQLFHPEFGAVLFHPWHGLLVYHPFYAVLALAALVAIVRAPDSKSKALLALVLLATGACLWLYAGWFCWWLGTGTFGQRGMTITVVPLLLAFAWFLARERAAGRRLWPWLLLTALCSAWSLGLLVQEDTNYYTFDPLWESQVAQFGKVAFPAALLAGVVVGFVSRGKRRFDALNAAAAFHVGLLVEWVRQGSLLRWERLTDSPSLVVAGVFFLGFVAWLLIGSAEARALWARRAFGVIVIGTFAGALLAFASLTRVVNAAIVEQRELPRRFIYRGHHYVQALTVSEHEYSNVDGFELQKAQLHAFRLRVQKAQQFRPPEPRPRHKRHRRSAVGTAR